MDIVVNNLGLGFGEQRLFAGVSFEVAAGQRYCVCGASGCGKSSLLRAMMGFVRPDSGEIVVGGVAVQERSVWEVRRNIGYVTQEPDLGQEKVLERMKRPFGYKANGHLNWDIDAVKGWFERFKLAEALLEKETGELSGGEKQRVAVIIALLLDRPVMLLDEVSSAMDKASRQVLREVLRELDKTIVFISHDEGMLDLADGRVEICGEGK